MLIEYLSCCNKEVIKVLSSRNVLWIKLSSEEKEQFDKSIKAVQDLFNAGKKIDTSL